METKRDNEEAPPETFADLAAAYLDIWETHGAFPAANAPLTTTADGAERPG